MQWHYQLPLGNMSAIAVEAQTELNTKDIYQLNATDDLPSGIIHLVDDHRIDQKYPKLKNISLLNTEYDAVYIQRKTVIGKLKPKEIEGLDVSSVSWTKKC